MTWIGRGEYDDPLMHYAPDEDRVCPQCGDVGVYVATTDDGIRMYECLICVNTCIGLDDVPYTFPLHFGSDGHVYI